MKKPVIFAVAALAAGIASAGSFDFCGCYANWDDTALTVGNSRFSRSYVVTGGMLRTVSIRSASGNEWIRDAVKGSKGKLKVSCSSEKRNPAGAEGLVARVSAGGSTTTIRVYPEASGVLVEQDWKKPLPELTVDSSKDAYHQARESAGKIYAASLKVGDARRFAPYYIRVTATTLFDQTDARNDLVKSDSWMMPSCQLNASVSATLLDVRDIATGEGLAFLRLAPMPVSRPVDIPDFIIGPGDRCVVPLANGYPVAELVYEGGDAGRIKALQDFQRSIRPYRPGRDGVFLSNTWGDGNRDSRIRADFLMKEVDAAADIGVDVIQVDDGWQRGRTANSSKKPLPGMRKTWSDFRAVDPKFWEPDEERFPQGLAPLAAAAKAKGLGFGLWFGPDSSDELKYWEEDADCLLDYYRKYGVRYFKIDALVITSPLGFERNRKFFDKMLKESDGDMVFDLDCTAAIRPGYFGLMDIGPLFVENRYARPGSRRYRPHQTLRNLWCLSHVVDPVRLRMELLNPGKQQELYAGEGDPLAPAKWPADALFAITMMASPLGWMELSDVSPEVRAAWKPLVSRWKKERSMMHSGTILPIGAEPDGWSWTGFFSCAKDASCAYALVFREQNAKDEFDVDLTPLVPSGTSFKKAEVIGGRGKAELGDKGLELEVEVPAKLDFAWVKLVR